MKIFLMIWLAVNFSLAAMAQSASIDVVLNPMGDFKAKTAEVKGEAKVKGDEVSAQNIVVNLKNFKSGVELRDKHTQKYLNTASYPEALLVSATGKGGKGKGKIKIKNVEKDIEGTYKVSGNFLTADFKLKLSEFDIKEINYMGVGVEDEITVHVTLPIKP